MTEEEIRIIVDRVFTELRNNSKTIAQLSEKTEVDNCWFEIDNGFKISLSTLKKYIAGTESINISDLSDLDNYKLSTHRGAFNVFRGNIYLGVLFIIQYQAPQHGGLQVFLSTFDYKMSGSSSLSMPSIIYRSTDYNNNQKWLEWKPYQNTFISDDGTVPTSGGLGFNNTNFAPSLRLFLEKIDYLKVIEWSGELLEGDISFEEESTLDVVPSEIYFSATKNTFFVRRLDKNYYSWLNKDDSSGINGRDFFIEGNAFTKNVFKGLNGSVWIATASDVIEQVNVVGSIPDGQTGIVEWSGEIVEDAVIVSPTLPPGQVLVSTPDNIVFVSGKNTFAYRYKEFSGSIIYYSNFDKLNKFQDNVYSESSFVPNFTKNIFIGLNGTVWFAISESKLANLVDEAPKDGKPYNRQNGRWAEAINEAPYIGENGNWYINGEDTGKPSRGVDGQDGADGVSLGEIALAQELSTEEGSENKVISQKIVSKELNDVKYIYYDEWESGYLKPDGSTAASSNYKRTPFIKLFDTSKNVFLFNTFTKLENTKGVCFYDSQKTFIQGYDTETGINIFPIPETSYYVRVCKKSNQDGIVALSRNESLDSVLNQDEDKDINIINFLPDAVFKDGWIDKEGEIHSASFNCIDFIRVIPNSKIKLKIKSGATSGIGGFYLYAFYSSTNARSYVSGKFYNDGEVVDFEETIDVPQNANYMRLTVGNKKENISILSMLSSTLWKYAVYSPDTRLNTIISVPYYLDCPTWRQTDIFLDNVIGSSKEVDINTIVYSECTLIGYNHLRIKKSVGNWTVNITKYWDVRINDIDNSAVFKARAFDKKTTKQNWNILIVGDSLIQSTTPVKEVYDLLQEDGDVTVSMIGSQGSSPYKHEGRGGWTWEKFISESSPFYINGKLDFKSYLQQQNPELSNIDIIIFALGSNDVGTSTYVEQTKIDNIVLNAKTLIDAAINEETGFPDAKVVIGLPAVGSPCIKQSLLFKMSITLLNQAYIRNFDNGAYNSNVTCVMHGAYIDRINSYRYTESAISEFSEEKVRTYTDLLHPSDAGYKQFGRGYYGKIRAIMSGIL